MKNKIKILVSTEYTKLGTGYGNYFRNLIIQLLQRDFEVVEYASYCFADDKSRISSPWKIIPAGPDRNNKELMKIYQSDIHNQYGAMFFDKTIAEEQPDIVIDQRDYWYCEHIAQSPARRFFKWIYTPTVDSRPARPEWLWIASQADILNTMTYFGKQTLQEEGNLAVKYICPAGADKEFLEFYEKWKGENKKTFRKKYGFPTDSFIIGFVSRNQPRKLFPDTIYCVDALIDQYDAYLWLHTSYPDNLGRSWDFPLFLSRIKHPERILFTYHCKNCSNVLVRPFADAVLECPRCKGPMFMPSPQYGFVPRNVQKELMYCCDLGVNPAIGGGLEMAIMEFKSLGIPTISNSYAGMDEQGLRSDKTIPNYPYMSYKGREEKPYLGGWNVNVYLWFEVESGQIRAFIDRNDFINKIKYFIELNDKEYKKWQQEAYQCVKYMYNWDIIGEKYAEEIVELGKSQHLYKMLPTPILDINNIISRIQSLPASKQASYWIDIIKPYRKIMPNIVGKIHADLVYLDKYGFTVDAKFAPIFKNQKDIFNFIHVKTNEINLFHQHLARVNMMQSSKGI